MPQERRADSYRARISARAVPRNDQERYWFLQADIQEIFGCIDVIEQRQADEAEERTKHNASRQFRQTSALVSLSIIVTAILHFIPGK